MKLFGYSRFGKAIVPVAGLGTRFLPLSKAVPKELFPLVDKPVLQYIIEVVKGLACITKGRVYATDEIKNFLNDDTHKSREEIETKV